MEDEGAGRLRRLDPRDPRAAVAACGVVAGGEHDGNGRACPPAELDVRQVAGRSGSERCEQITVDERQQRLRLGVAEAAVVLEHPRAGRGQHQPREQRPDERAAPGRELRQDGAAREVDQLLDLVDAEAGNRSERPHPPGVRAPVTVLRALEVLRDGQRERRDTVAESEYGHLGALEQLLDDERACEPFELGKPGRHLGLRPADDDPFAGREAVGLEHARCHRLGECRRSGHSRGGHDRLGERLRALDRRGDARRAEYQDAHGSEKVGEAGNERYLGPDDDEVDLERAREAEHGLVVVRADRVTLPESRDAGVAGCGVQLRQQRRLDELPGQRVLTATGSHEKNAHCASYFRSRPACRPLQGSCVRSRIRASGFESCGVFSVSTASRPCPVPTSETGTPRASSTKRT